MSTTSRISESPAHLALKRVALQWAQQNGFRIAATEVSLPNRGVRMDVAAYRPQRVKKQKNGKNVSCAAIGVTAIFECKVSSPDFRRDARSIIATTKRLQILHAKKLTIEDELKIFYPSIRNGDSLFQEFETLNFERPGYERYEKVIGEIRQLSLRHFIPLSSAARMASRSKSLMTGIPTLCILACSGRQGIHRA